jgi:hypothetical protein
VTPSESQELEVLPVGISKLRNCGARAETGKGDRVTKGSDSSHEPQMKSFLVRFWSIQNMYSIVSGSLNGVEQKQSRGVRAQEWITATD